LPSATQPDEVVEVFLGDTLEEAMSRAVARLGADLTVRRARKVRKGVQGLVGKDRFEVVAVPAPHQAAAQAVDGAFEALLMQAEEAEDPVVRRAADAHHEAESEQPLLRVVRPRAAPEPEVIQPRRVIAPAAPTQGATALAAAQEPAPAVFAAAAAPAPFAAPAPAPAPAPASHRSAAPARKPVRAPRPAPTKKAPLQRAEPVGWGAEALRQLGLPRSLLSQLPAKEPRTDAQWIAALTRAFAAVVPAAHEPSPSHPVVVDGVGIEGVRGILSAAARGMTPGRIHYGDRTALATPTELTLAVRAEVMA